MALRNYSDNAPVLQTTGGSLTSTATTIPVPSTAGYPPPPFLIAINRGQSDQEVCLCTGTTSNTFQVIRGYDNTTAVGHGPQAVIEHTTAAIEFREANAYVNLMTTAGDIIYQGSTGAARLGIGGTGTLLGAVNGFPTWTQPMVRIPQSYSVSGLLGVPSGSTNYLPPFYFSLLAGQTATISKVRASIRSGSSVTLLLGHNASNLVWAGGATTITITTTPTTFSLQSAVTVNDMDSFNPAVTGTAGNPDGLSLSAFFDVAI